MKEHYFTETDGTQFVELAGECVISGKPHSVTVPVKQWEAYKAGALAQNAFPTLPAEDREFIISGICPESWAELFGE